MTRKRELLIVAATLGLTAGLPGPVESRTISKPWTLGRFNSTWSGVARSPREIKAVASVLTVPGSSRRWTGS